MRFYFSKAKLRKLYETEAGAQKLPEGLVDAFFEVIQMIDAAEDSRTFYQAKILHFEKLQGQKEKPPRRSMRLNDQYRLEVKLHSDEEGEFLEVVKISKHYE